MFSVQAYDGFVVCGTGRKTRSLHAHVVLGEGLLGHRFPPCLVAVGGPRDEHGPALLAQLAEYLKLLSPSNSWGLFSDFSFAPGTAPASG